MPQSSSSLFIRAVLPTSKTSAILARKTHTHHTMAIVTTLTDIQSLFGVNKILLPHARHSLSCAFSFLSKIRCICESFSLVNVTIPLSSFSNKASHARCSSGITSVQPNSTSLHDDHRHPATPSLLHILRILGRGHHFHLLLLLLLVLRHGHMQSTMDPGPQYALSRQRKPIIFTEFPEHCSQLHYCVHARAHLHIEGGPLFLTQHFPHLATQCSTQTSYHR